MKQVPDSVDLNAVFAEHKFGGARMRPVRMDAAMTGQLTREQTEDGKQALGIKMVWTLLIEERVEAGAPNSRGTRGTRRASYAPVVTLVAEADEGLPKLLRDVADLIERGNTPVHRKEDAPLVDPVTVNRQAQLSQPATLPTAEQLERLTRRPG